MLPTFRCSGFRHPPRSLQAPWGPGMLGTHYVLRGDEYHLHIQDASPAMTGRASLKKKSARRQRGGIYLGARANNPSAARIAEMRQALQARRALGEAGRGIGQAIQRAVRTRAPNPAPAMVSRGGLYPGARANNPLPSRIAQMERAVRARHPTNRRRQQVASRALANRPSERLARSVNRALWSVHRRLTPTSLTSKLGAAAALGGAAAAAPIALLSSLLASAVKKKE